MADRRFFEPALFRFLGELQRNNNRTWFAENRARYENSVQTPAVRFVTEIGPRLRTISTHVIANPRPFGGSISRIYRDVRFSKDKSPFHTHVGIHFAHELSRTSDEHLPGFYLHIAPGDSIVASGIWRPSPPALKRIRDTIIERQAAWRKVRSHALELGGESYARVPAGYDPDHPFAVDLKRKDFYTSKPIRDADVTSPAFGSTFLRLCRSIDGLNHFLAEAVGVPW